MKDWDGEVWVAILVASILPLLIIGMFTLAILAACLS